MNKLYVVLALSAIISLSACGITKKTLGLQKSGPDESLVQTNTPLILPPEYNLRPSSSALPKKKDEQEDVASESDEQ